MTDNENPLDRLFIEDRNDRPDDVVLDELTTMPTREFVDCLEAIADASEAVNTLAADVETLRQTGLTDADAKALLYGRNHDLGKRDIETLFDATDRIAGGKADRPLVRLLSDLSGETLSDTETFIEELDRLRRKYGGGADE